MLEVWFLTASKKHRSKIDTSNTDEIKTKIYTFWLVSDVDVE